MTHRRGVENNMLPDKIGKKKSERILSKLIFVWDTYWKTRQLFSLPDDAAHLINENMVVRFASILESNGINPGLKTPCEDEDGLGIQALFILRHIILHDADGHLRWCNVQDAENRKLIYYKFCDSVPDVKVEEGKRLCLAIDTVLAPLAKKCINYILKISQ